MNRSFISITVALLIGTLTAVPPITASSCCQTDDTQTDSCKAQTGGPLEQLLSQMQEATAQLKTYQADIEYAFVQDPELLDATTIRTGQLYYLKTETESQIRVNFLTVQRDDSEILQERLDYIFDGVWLTKIDYKTEIIEYHQQAPENQPVDVFEFISHNLPLLGFTGIDRLKDDFDLSEAHSFCKDPNSMGIHLKTKEESLYRKEYTNLDFCVSTDSYLPLQIAAESVHGDTYDLTFTNIQVNKILKNPVFRIETPKGFRENKIPLEEK